MCVCVYLLQRDFLNQYRFLKEDMSNNFGRVLLGKITPKFIFRNNIACFAFRSISFNSKI